MASRINQKSTHKRDGLSSPVQVNDVILSTSPYTFPALGKADEGSLVTSTKKGTKCPSAIRRSACTAIQMGTAKKVKLSENWEEYDQEGQMIFNSVVETKPGSEEEATRSQGCSLKQQGLEQQKRTSARQSEKRLDQNQIVLDVALEHKEEVNVEEEQKVTPSGIVCNKEAMYVPAGRARKGKVFMSYIEEMMQKRSKRNLHQQPANSIDSEECTVNSKSLLQHKDLSAANYSYTDYRCTVCTKKFQTWQLLKTHRRSTHPKNVMEFINNQASKMKTKTAQIDISMQPANAEGAVKSDKTVKYVKQSNKIHNLKPHMQALAGGMVDDKQHVFTRNRDLRKATCKLEMEEAVTEKATVGEQAGPHNTCPLPLCQLSFKNQLELRRHVQIHHKLYYKCMKVKNNEVSARQQKEIAEAATITSKEQGSQCQQGLDSLQPAIKQEEVTSAANSTALTGSEQVIAEEGESLQELHVKKVMDSQEDTATVSKDLMSCGSCGKVFKSVDSLELHEAVCKLEMEQATVTEKITAVDKARPQMPCPLCLLPIHTELGMRLHIERCHNDYFKLMIAMNKKVSARQQKEIPDAAAKAAAIIAKEKERQLQQDLESLHAIIEQEAVTFAPNSTALKNCTRKTITLSEAQIKEVMSGGMEKLLQAIAEDLQKKDKNAASITAIGKQQGRRTFKQRKMTAMKSEVCARQPEIEEAATITAKEQRSQCLQGLGSLQPAIKQEEVTSAANSTALTGSEQVIAEEGESLQELQVKKVMDSQEDTATASKDLMSCGSCGKAFKSVDSLELHEAVCKLEMEQATVTEKITVLDEASPHMPCPLCLFPVHNQNGMNLHVQRCHKDYYKLMIVMSKKLRARLQKEIPDAAPITGNKKGLQFQQGLDFLHPTIGQEGDTSTPNSTALENCMRKTISLSAAQMKEVMSGGTDKLLQLMAEDVQKKIKKAASVTGIDKQQGCRIFKQRKPLHCARNLPLRKWPPYDRAPAFHVHRNDVPRLFSCSYPQCTRTYAHERHLRRHEVLNHGRKAAQRKHGYSTYQPYNQHRDLSSPAGEN